MSLAYQKLLVPLTRRPALTHGGESQHRLDVVVMFTSATATIGALRTASALADRLSARITLLVPQIVPYVLPLESPPVLLDFSESQCRRIAMESTVETMVKIYLCRDRMELLKSVLAPRSLVVVGGRGYWWPSREKNLARQLRRAGHEVILTETE